MSDWKYICWRFWKVLAASGRRMLRQEVPRDAAGISYFVIIALFPAIFVIIAVADSFLVWMHLNTTVVEIIISLFPGSNQFVRSNLAEIMVPTTIGVVSCIILVFWAASWIFSFIERSINRAWDIPNKRTFWESRLRTVALLTLGSVILVVLAALTTFVRVVRAQAEAHIHLGNLPVATHFTGWFWYSILLLAGVLGAVFVFALIYKWTPHCKVFWQDAFTGAVIAAIMWEIAGYIFMQVVPLFDYQQVYGMMGAVVALLAWVYTSNIIILFGANFCAQMHWIRLERPDRIFNNKPLHDGRCRGG